MYSGAAVQQEIEKIKRQLELDESQDAIISDLYRQWTETALGICNRKEVTETMAGIIRDTVIAAYRKRGGEGMTGYSAGDQSYTYESLREELFHRLLQANQRVFKI